MHILKREIFWNRDHCRRSGFTLLELLVAIGVIALLLALLLPAVQHAREAARRTRCASNLRQISLAVLNYEGSFRMLPPGTGGNTTWLGAILPQLELQAMIDEYGVNGDFPLLSPPTPQLYQCPTDPLASAEFSSYAGNFGAVTQRDGANGLFRHAPSDYVWPLQMSGDIRLRDITDGTSQTAMASEVLAAPPFQTISLLERRANWITPIKYWEPHEAEQFLDLCLTMPDGADGHELLAGDGWHINGITTALYTHHLPPNSPRCKNGGDLLIGSYSPSSLHGHGAHVAFADGHVKFISGSMDRATWQAIGSRDGGEVVSSF